MKGGLPWNIKRKPDGIGPDGSKKVMIGVWWNRRRRAAPFLGRPQTRRSGRARPLQCGGNPQAERRRNGDQVFRPYQSIGVPGALGSRNRTTKPI